MNKKALFAGILAVLLMMVICFKPGYSAPLTIRFSVGMPENHFLTQQYVEWGKLVEKNSNGEIKVQIYPSAQLFKDNEVTAAVQSGAVEAGEALTIYLGNQLIPGIKVFMFPFLFKSTDEAVKLYKSEVGMAWKETAEQKGVKLMALVAMPDPEADLLLTTKPVKVPADLKGMVIRVVSPETAAMVQKWGAGPAFLTGAEVYLALQRGTVGGALNSLTTYVQLKQYEVAPYVNMLRELCVQTFIAMNKNFFDRMTPSQQKAVLDASATIEADTVNFAMKTLKAVLEEAKEKNVKIHEPTPAELNLWTEGMSSIWEDEAKKNPDVAATLKKVREMLKR
jgi:C4-dicarboxylate-binding protein DctP